MKRIISIILAICMISTLFCMTAIGAQAASDDVFRISGQKKDGSLVELKSTSSFADGWNYAIEKAIDHDWLSENGYVRIVADLLADWNAVDGEFGSGDGFKWDTIFVEEDAIITLNLNSHTINRGLTDWEYNGEVISVDDDVDLIINGGNCTDNTVTGTITGGFSCNGAGGIHIEEDVNITLNNVNIVGNVVEDDYGAAMAILDGSKLTMNGGKIANNKLTAGGFDILGQTRGVVYIEDADATFNNVLFTGNIAQNFYYDGLVIYQYGDSDVTLNECIIENHGQNTINSDDGTYVPANLFYSLDEDSKLTLNKCTLKNNAGARSMFITCKTVVNECTFTGNSFNVGIFAFSEYCALDCEVTNSTFTDNPCPVIRVQTNFAIKEDQKMIATNCTFNNNGTSAGFSIGADHRVEIKLVDCELGDTVLHNKEYIAIIDTSAENGAENKNNATANPNADTGIGSVIGEGSLTMIVAFLALFISIAAIGAIIASNKKRAASAKSGTTKQDE